MIEREDARENKKKTIDISITKTNTFFSHHHIDSDGVMNRIYRNKKKKKNYFDHIYYHHEWWC